MSSGYAAILFYGKRRPSEIGAVERAAFLTSLAVEGNFSASTQKNEDFGGRDICYLNDESSIIPSRFRIQLAKHAYVLMTNKVRLLLTLAENGSPQCASRTPPLVSR